MRSGLRRPPGLPCHTHRTAAVVETRLGRAADPVRLTSQRGGSAAQPAPQLITDQVLGGEDVHVGRLKSSAGRSIERLRCSPAQSLVKSCLLVRCVVLVIQEELLVVTTRI